MRKSTKKNADPPLCAGSPTRLEAPLGQQLLVPCKMLAEPQVDLISLNIQSQSTIIAILIYILSAQMFQNGLFFHWTFNSFEENKFLSLSPSKFGSPSTTSSLLHYHVLRFNRKLCLRYQDAICELFVSLSTPSPTDYGTLECGARSSLGASTQPCIFTITKPGVSNKLSQKGYFKHPYERIL